MIPRDADAAVVALTRRQHGIVTSRQLLEAGLGPNAVAAKVARGWLRRIHRAACTWSARSSPS